MKSIELNFLKGLIGVVTTVGLAWMGWASLTLITHSNQLSAIDEHLIAIDQHATSHDALVESAISQINASLSGVKGYKDPPVFSTTSVERKR